MLRTTAKDPTDEIKGSPLKRMKEQTTIQQPRCCALISRLSEYVRLHSLENFFGISSIADEIRQDKDHAHKQRRLDGSSRPCRGCRDKRSFGIQRFVEAQKPKHRDVVEYPRVTFDEHL